MRELWELATSIYCWPKDWRGWLLAPAVWLIGPFFVLTWGACMVIEWLMEGY